MQNRVIQARFCLPHITKESNLLVLVAWRYECCIHMKSHILTAAEIAPPQLALFMAKQHFVMCKTASPYLTKCTLLVIKTFFQGKESLKKRWIGAILNEVLFTTLETSEVFEQELPIAIQLIVQEICLVILSCAIIQYMAFIISKSEYDHICRYIFHQWVQELTMLEHS